jgi:hypothetical protein
VATTNSQSCTNASKNGTITINPPYTGCNTSNISLGAVGFTSSTTYSVNGLTLSSPVTATYCNNRTYSTFDGGSSGAYKADCAVNARSASYGNWFSWCMAVQYAAQLCPYPWRVPTKQDLCLIMNGSTTNCSTTAPKAANWLGFDWYGYVLPNWYYGGSGGYVMSSTEISATHVAFFDVWIDWSYWYEDREKHGGYTLRCVR